MGKINKKNNSRTLKIVDLDKLTLYRFKNHQELTINFPQRISAITGSNGSGKTAILDAIYMLCTCKSYFNHIDYQLVYNQENLCGITGVFKDNEVENTVQVLIEQAKKKKVKFNEKFYDKLIEHIGKFMAVMITPDDIDLVKGNSDERRKFIDVTICQFDRIYLNNLNEYNKIIEQRNKQLKNFAQHQYFDEIILESFQKKLEPLMLYIFEKRKDFIFDLNSHFSSIYNWLCDNQEKVEMKYICDLNEHTPQYYFENNLQKDLALQRTTFGTHKDDLEFEINGYGVKKFASQGQGKLFVIALKLSQYKLLLKNANEVNNFSKPILMLDDIFEKIDENRAQKLIDLILNDEEFSQIIITDTHEQRVKNHFKNNLKEINFVELK